MSETLDEAAQRLRYWPVPVLRAIPAGIVALVITFSPNHAAGLGSVLFGAYAFVEGLVQLLSAQRFSEPRARRLTVLIGAVSMLFGIIAFPLMLLGVQGLIAGVVGFAVVTGGLELVQGLRARKSESAPFANDWITIGGLTVLLAVAYLLTPADYSKRLGGVEHVPGVLDASVILVGLFGAYLALATVFHLIAGFSYKWGTTASRRLASNGAPHA